MGPIRSTVLWPGCIARVYSERVTGLRSCAQDEQQDLLQRTGTAELDLGLTVIKEPVTGIDALAPGVPTTGGRILGSYKVNANERTTALTSMPTATVLPQRKRAKSSRPAKSSQDPSVKPQREDPSNLDNALTALIKLYPLHYWDNHSIGHKEIRSCMASLGELSTSDEVKQIRDKWKLDKATAVYFWYHDRTAIKEVRSSTESQSKQDSRLTRFILANNSKAGGTSHLIRGIRTVFKGRGAKVAEYTSSLALVSCSPRHVLKHHVSSQEWNQRIERRHIWSLQNLFQLELICNYPGTVLPANSQDDPACVRVIGKGKLPTVAVLGDPLTKPMGHFIRHCLLQQCRVVSVDAGENYMDFQCTRDVPRHTEILCDFTGNRALINIPACPRCPPRIPHPEVPFSDIAKDKVESVLDLQRLDDQRSPLDSASTYDMLPEFAPAQPLPIFTSSSSESSDAVEIITAAVESPYVKHLRSSRLCK